MDKNLEKEIGQWLTAQRRTLATAESCTGGLIASRVTDIAGSSDYFLGGVVAYSNQAKAEVLGVSESTLIAQGAVSQQTVEEMAQGAAALFAADVAVSISGIMGPGGGSEQKPVGTTWICVLVEGVPISKCYRFTGDRLANKEAAAETALGLLLARLKGQLA